MTVIEVVHPVSAPGVTESDVIRWVGVAVAVAGAILATPEGIASLWRSVRQRHDEVMVVVRRLLRRPRNVTVSGSANLGAMGIGGRVYASRWRKWLPEADADLKIEILHAQVDILAERIDELRKQADRANDDLEKKIKESEARVTAKVQQLSSEVHGERSQASRVDARGFGPIALGIVLTGLPDELATAAWIGYMAIVVSVAWTFAAAFSWLRDYRQALERDKN